MSYFVYKKMHDITISL